MIKRYIIGIDEGTTSCRAGVYDIKKNKLTHIVQKPLKLYFPKAGWVEHDVNEIWKNQLSAITEVVKQSNIDPDEIFGIGITNQRESVVAWDSKTGIPVPHSICWQCRRTARIIENLSAKTKRLIKEKTGLIADAYFSASKIQWFLENEKEAQKLLANNRLLVGTMDTFLIWKLTNGKSFVTDTTNASRTMLFNIHTLDWDDELLKIFGVPRKILPKIVSCSENVGFTDILGKPVQIAGIAGDQQSALFGQACFNEGMVKNTYGTGGFLLMNTGDKVVQKDKLVSTVAYTLNRKTCYALEGSVFNSGSTVQWIRDQLGLIKKSAETEKMAFSVPDTGGVYIVPAFTGLGAPYWNMKARGTIVGITRGTNKNHIARAVLESMAYQTEDILNEMEQGSTKVLEVRCDGGASVNNFLMQFQSDISDKVLKLPANQESTLMGTIYLAGLGTGAFKSIKEIENLWEQKKIFKPGLAETKRKELYYNWKRAVNRSLDWAD